MVLHGESLGAQTARVAGKAEAEEEEEEEEEESMRYAPSGLTVISSPTCQSSVGAVPPPPPPKLPPPPSQLQPPPPPPFPAVSIRLPELVQTHTCVCAPVSADEFIKSLEGSIVVCKLAILVSLALSLAAFTFLRVFYPTCTRVIRSHMHGSGAAQWW
ncbi:hypothetical protein EGR_02627 [Echinococcus granulosus]|uniref:Uncharacterized protein n=1 Tax=Echinococcus granulosus TaxID=6210 RepID=W6ULT6_ECHGR|nr:hypothetical protein EGR_02627 [Echinococcus granulosus]EUB62495.1 hypothetical protein EGR_02627 [Echinococcus granulosus]